MSEGVRLELGQLDRFGKLLKKIEKKGGRVEVPMKKWGVYMLGQIGFAFDHGGRGRNKWPPLKESTIENRRFRRGGRTGPKKILRDRGTYAASWRTKQLFSIGGKAEQSVRTDYPYASIHQDGATIPARTITPKKAGGTLRFWHDGGVRFAKKVEIPSYTIPKRAIEVEDQDERKAVGLALEHLREIITKGGARKR